MKIKRKIQKMKRIGAEKNSFSGVKKVVISDYRDYVPELSNNGGKYAFFDTYQRVGVNDFILSFDCSTSCCPKCGHIWANCCEYEDYTHFTEKEIKKIVNSFEAEEGYYLETVR